MSLPKYDQIADDLRARIVAGEYKPGDSLPSIRVLQEKWGCSDGPVREAFGVLLAEGRITSGRGARARVSKAAAESPKYARIVADLKERIFSGFILPSESELAAEYEVSRPTVVRALSVLRQEGWIETRQGSGSVGLGPPPDREQLARAALLRLAEDGGVLGAARIIDIVWGEGTAFRWLAEHLSACQT